MSDVTLLPGDCREVIKTLAEKFGAILIEREAEYLSDIEARLAYYRGHGKHALNEKNRSPAKINETVDLFTSLG